MKKAIRDLKDNVHGPAPKSEITNKGMQTEVINEVNDGLFLEKDRLSLNLGEAYQDYFRLRDSNVEGRADVFGSLFN